MLNIDAYEAVIFDLDSTLTNTHQYPIVASEWLLKKYGIYSDELASSYIRNLVIRYRKAIQAIVDGAPFRSPFDIILVAMKNSLLDIDQKVDSVLVEEATHRFKALHLELSTPYEGVTDILEKLKARAIRLGVISNSFAGHARIILTNLELDHFFSSIVDCGDVSAFKPMKEPFERVLREVNTEASKALYIGDEYYADMVGAKLVGMTTVWINNRNVSLEDQVAKYGVSSTPDFVLKSTIEFLQLI
ncbi:MAG: HAD family hydrolase [Candidatus Thorarchaeota archaeon]